ncbi:MAG: ABC transporter permease [Acidobacteriota bacterium]|nr:ABC transporter permease [Acidobacteriota bacterium]
MNSVRFVLAEAWNEFRAGLRGPMLPLCFAGLVAYLFFMVLNAEYMREVGGTSVPRNSPGIVYLVLPAQCLWLFFAWAWLFAQVVARDRTASLHEVVLAAPVSLRLLLFGRYLGAAGLACLLSAGLPVGFALMPLLVPLGLLPPEAVGPTPWFALAHSMALFIVPGTLGLGALFVWAAVRTRGSRGPFALAAAVMLVWMIALSIIRGTEAHLEVASMLDPAGFSEVEEQTLLWTPQEKRTSALVHTAPLVVNRLLWLFGPLLFSVLALARLRREQLTLERAPNRKARQPAAGLRDRKARRFGGRFLRRRPAPPGGPLPGRPAAPSWIRVAMQEAAWHLAVSLRGWGILFAALTFLIVTVWGGLFSVTQYADGPLIPRSAVVLPALGDFSYVIIVFLAAGFAGAMLRRDARPGYAEIVDAAPAPLGSRLAGRLVAVAGLTLAITLVPALAALVTMALAAPDSLNALDPLLFFALMLGPPILELAGITVLAHALFSNAGIAYAVGMIGAFVAIVNNEIGVVTYPPGQFGIPVMVVLSEFSGWAPWVGPLAAGGAFKLGLLALVGAVAWLAWPHGVARETRDRLRAAAVRIRGGAGWLAAAGVVTMVASGALLHDRLVREGGYRSPAAADAEDAAWERRFWQEPARFSVEGGEVRIEVDPGARVAVVDWRLRGVRSEALHASLPAGAAVGGVALGGAPAAFTVAHDHLEVPLDGCGVTGCELALSLTVSGAGWPGDGPAPWGHSVGAWLRAEDVLPALGLDPGRVLRAPVRRSEHGLEADPQAPPVPSLVSAGGVAPTGSWAWSVEFTEPGFRTATSGETSAPLDFAVGWWREPPLETRSGDLVVLHGPQRSADAGVVLRDVNDMRACVADLLGEAPRVDSILQAPRRQGVTALHGRLLWLPENEGWDVAPGGSGHFQRRARIARAMAGGALTGEADLRREPGAAWLQAGVAGWIGMECVRRRDGVEAWRVLQQRGADGVVGEFGDLEAPATSVARAGDAAWVGEYAPLASMAWAGTVGSGQALRIVREVTRAIRTGTPLPDALRAAAGPAAAADLLGAPAASDIVLTREGSELGVEGTRWRWTEGGWQPLSMPVHVMQRFERDPGPPGSRIGPLPATIEPADAGFTLLDAWPGFERTPADNVWRGER